MKKLIFCLLFIVSALGANAQGYDTVLNENFNVSCASATGFPLDWYDYNPIASTIPNGEWQCTSAGESGTPGIACTSIWGSPSAYYLDTAYLITPALNISGYSGNIYLQFDSKTTNIYLDGRLDLIASQDSTFRTGLFDLDSSLTPVFTQGDSAGWVTHQVNLTPFKSSIPLYIAFLYTGTTSSGSTWTLDNILLTPYTLAVANIIKNTLPLTVIGASTTSQITLSYKTELSGIYQITIYDITGHKVYEEDVNTSQGSATYIISGLQLHSGMYLVKMGNGLVYGTTKTVVP